jgi:hypothetical protein
VQSDVVSLVSNEILLSSTTLLLGLGFILFQSCSSSTLFLPCDTTEEGVHVLFEGKIKKVRHSRNVALKYSFGL